MLERGNSRTATYFFHDSHLTELCVLILSSALCSSGAAGVLRQELLLDAFKVLGSRHNRAILRCQWRLKVGAFTAPRDFRIATNNEPRQLRAPPVSTTSASSSKTHEISYCPAAKALTGMLL
jgi:hypothetical protein